MALRIEFATAAIVPSGLMVVVMIAGCDGPSVEPRDAGPEDAALGEDAGHDACIGCARASIVHLDMGPRHTCAVRDDGSVYCWGDNRSFQAGVSEGDEQHSPHRVEGISDAIEVAVGADHTCARTRGGAVYCWGDGSRGALGDGLTQSRSTPAVVAGLPGPVVEIAAGAFHMCARTAAGGLYCWGNNPTGQLGPASTATREPQPVAVPGIDDALDVEAGTTQTCVRRAASIQCWGYLGANLGDVREPRTVGELTDAVSLSLRADHACARRATGEVVCWGDNRYGQIDDGAAVHDEPQAVDGIEGASEVEAGSYHSCARFDDGRVYCWGRNDDGQLGDGLNQQRPNPAPVLMMTDAVTMSAGNGSCALRGDGDVWCWGENSFGQIGNGADGPSNTPTRVLGLR